MEHNFLLRITSHHITRRRRTQASKASVSENQPSTLNNAVKIVQYDARNSAYCTMSLTTNLSADLGSRHLWDPLGLWSWTWRTISQVHLYRSRLDHTGCLVRSITTSNKHGFNSRCGPEHSTEPTAM